VVVVGTGNVGLIVGYQLLQAGAQLSCVVEAAPSIGGYAVHANKLRRAGVPFYLGHTVVKAAGRDSVEEVHIAPVDNCFCPIMEESFVVDADTIALAVGLHPRIELSQMAGANIVYNSVMGGHIPNHNADMKIRESYFVAGDASGVEEASTAMEEGRLAGLAAAVELGHLDPISGEQQRSDVRHRLQTLRSGDFGAKRAAAKAEIFAEHAICDGAERK
jgi:thioredoxin reductase